jgi:hypothetical protein
MNTHTSTAGKIFKGIGVAGALLGTAGLFLPFSMSTSPLELLIEEFDLFYFATVGQLFVSIPILFYTLRQLFAKDLSGIERGIAYGFSGISICITSIFFGLALFESVDGFFELIPLIAPLLIGIGVLAGSFRKQDPRGLSALVALQVAFISATTLPLLTFASYSGLEAGAFCILAAAVLFTFQAIWICLERALEKIKSKARLKNAQESPDASAAPCPTEA